MRAREEFDLQLRAALADLAAAQTPDYIDTVLGRAVNRRQRPAWTFLERWIPMALTNAAPRLAPALPWRMIIILMLLAVAMVLAIAVGVGTLRQGVPPYGPAANGQLVYSRGGDIFASDTSGAGEHAIVSGPLNDLAPLFSRDGTRIAFIREHAGGQTADLVGARADGSEVTTLVTGIEFADWAPDSRRLAVIHWPANAASLSIVSADNGETLKTFDLGGVEPVGWVAWRPPAGSEILFKGRDRNDGTSAAQLKLYSISADGSDLHPLLTSPTSDPDLSFLEPQVSPDGTRLAYTTWGPNDAGIVDAWAHITVIDDQEDRLEERFSAPRFSPDGSLVVGAGHGEFLLAASDGTGEARRVGPTFPEGAFYAAYEFSPDGKSIVMTLDDPGVTWLVDVATGVGTPVGSEMPALPTWQRLAP